MEEPDVSDHGEIDSSDHEVVDTPGLMIMGVSRETVTSADIPAPSLQQDEMQDGHNFYSICPNLQAQYECLDENNEDLYLPPPVLFQQPTADPYDGVTEMCLNQDSTIDSTMADVPVPDCSDVLEQMDVYNNVAPGGHVSPETEQVSSPGSCSSTHLEEHDDEDDDDDAAIDTEIQSSDHEEVPIETVIPPNRPSTNTYDAIVASEGKIVEAENRRHSDLMTVLERMIALQEETISQLAHLHRVFIEVPKQLQKINTSFEALVVQQTQANYLRMTTVPHFNFNTSQAGSLHAGNFSPHASELHSPGPNVTGQVADIAVQVPDDILPLPSVQNQELTPTKEATKTKQHKQLLLTSFWTHTKKDTHETDQPSLVQCLPTCSHVSVGTSPVGESLAKSPVGEQSLPTSPVGESLAKSPVGEQSLPKSPVGESLAKSPVGESLATSPVGESLAKSPVGESLATSPAREVPEATQSGSVVAKVVAK
ncbi:uncharacterized protein LOC142500887 [Ascaphus truei]|uniref:uncharacterized protein LOC142500887 n=1 Tax=Ascaphus truei TaxID=8439 RepID=UPI003F599D2A